MIVISRFLLLSTFFLFALSGYSQSPFQVVEAVHKDRSRSFAERSLHYNIDIESLKKQMLTTNDEFELSLQTLDGKKTLLLQRFQLLAGSYELKTENGIQESSARKYNFFKGSVKGEPHSYVGMSLIKEEIHLLIHDPQGSYEVSKVRDTDQYSGLYTDEIFQKQYIPCETDTDVDFSVKEEKNEIVNRSGQLECVEIYLEVDYSAYKKNGETIESAESWVLALMAQVGIFFHDAGTPITVSGIKIYTSSAADPYRVEGNTAEALSAFRDSMNHQGFNGRLAHLLSGRGIGGGRAYLNVLCSNSSNYGVSGNLSAGGTTYGTYTWNINVVAHELGHNFGSQHTHDCVWNGNYTQIDDCGNVWAENKGYFTGSCYDNENKILPGSNNATIMSYCHVASGASINLNLGFHQQVRDRMYSNFVATSCAGSETCVGVPPFNDDCAGAISLTPTTSCSPLVFDNLYATNSDVNPDFSCGGTIGVNDVWFKVIIPSNGKLTIETRQLSSGLTDLVMQVYSGTCNSLLAQSCDDNSGDGNHAQINIDDISLADQELLIRLVSKTDDEGEFGICTYSSELPCNEIIEDLVNFYNSAGGENWINNSGWAEGAEGIDCNYCDWYGITCNSIEQITDISLYNNNLSGTLGSDLMVLDQLESITLSENDLSGEVPENFINLVPLKYVDLSYNNLQGTLPENLVGAPLLESLVAGNNNFSGDLPKFTYSSKLNYIDLANNDFSGCYPSVYSRFLYSGEVSLSGNVDLAYEGNFYSRPSNYAGFDFDLDGYCNEIDDCNDWSNTVYNGASELCDGIDNDCDGEVDEGLDSGPNKWVGPDTGGSWLSNENWQMGHVPLACEDVEIGMEGENIAIESSGSQQGHSQNVKSLCLGPNAMLNMERNFSLYLRHGYLLNMGDMNLKGYTNISEIDPSKDAIVNYGSLTIHSGTYVYIANGANHTILNRAGGVLLNQGDVFIDSGDSLSTKAGIRNEGIINNSGRIEIVGSYSSPVIELIDESELNCTGELILGGASQGEEGSN